MNGVMDAVFDLWPPPRQAQQQFLVLDRRTDPTAALSGREFFCTFRFKKEEVRELAVMLHEDLQHNDSHTATLRSP